MHRTWLTRLLSVGTTAVVLTACSGEQEVTDAAAAPSGEAEEPEDPADTDEPADAAAAEDADGPEQPPFDPSLEIRPADIETREWGVGEPENPYEVLVLPDDFVLPATAVPVTWAPPEEPFGGAGSRHGGSGAFHVFDADPADVAAFFTDRLPDRGWELEEEETDGDSWRQEWAAFTDWDGWEEDWQHAEMAVAVSVRLIHLPSDGGDHSGTLQFHYRAEPGRR